jgi:hypothetical protein
MDSVAWVHYRILLFLKPGTVFQMPRARDIIVPVAVKGISEVVSKHTITKRGTIRTTEKIVPILRPSKGTTSGRSSRSRTKAQQPQNQQNEVDASEGAPPTFDNAQPHPYVDEDLYEHPEATSEGPRPQATTVCIGGC